MVIISVRAIRNYCLLHPEHTISLERWYKLTLKADWQNFYEIKDTFNSVDAVGDGLYVFNIKGNQCRLVVRIIFKTRTVFIRFVGSHIEYDNLNNENL